MSKRIRVKPGKSQSRLGFAVGIVFVLIGCFVVIPVFGVFGIFWTLIAGFIAFSNYKNAFTDQGMATHEIVIDEDGEFASFSDSNGNSESSDMDIEAKLKKLESLYNQGLISHDEYTQKRKEFLDEF